MLRLRLQPPKLLPKPPNLVSTGGGAAARLLGFDGRGGVLTTHHGAHIP